MSAILQYNTAVHSTQAHSLLAVFEQLGLLAVFEQLGLLAVCMQPTCSMHAAYLQYESSIVIADRQSCLQ
jgi:hypothetical protein